MGAILATGTLAIADGEPGDATLAKALSLEGEHKYSEADRLFADAAEEAHAGGALDVEIDALDGRFRVLHALADFPRARSVAERLLEAQSRDGRLQDAWRTEANIGGVNSALGNHDRALYHLNRALTAFSSSRQPFETSFTRSSIAVTQYWRGEIGAAWDAAEQAVRDLEGLRPGKDLTEALAYALGVQGTVLARLGDFKAAESVHSRILALLPAAPGDPDTRADALCNRGIARTALGRVADARKDLDDALAIYRATGDAPSEGVTLEALGDLEKREDNAKAALEHFRRARELADTGSFAATNALLKAADALRMLGRLDEALAEYLVASREADALFDRELRLGASAGLAEVYFLRKDHANAVKRAMEVASLARSLASGMSDEQQVSARARYFEGVEFGLRSGLADDKIPEFVDLVEAGRSAALLSNLGGRAALRILGLDDAQRAEELKAYEAVRAAEVYVGAADDRVQADERRIPLDAARAKYRNVVSRIEKDAWEKSRVRQTFSSSLGDIQGGLWPGEVLVLYVLLPDEAIAVVITDKTSRFAKLGPRERFDELCKAVKALPEGKAWSDATAALAERLFGDLSLDPATKVLLLSPDGEMADLPFPALLERSALAKAEMGLIPSGSVYRLLAREKTKRGTGTLALADPSGPKGARLRTPMGKELDPLVGARKEVDVFPAGLTPYVGEKASETQLLTELRRTERWHDVHLACHCLIDSRNPGLSALVLAPDGSNDGLLTTLDVFRLDVNTDLVTLSACESTGGPVVTGEGTIGFVRAWMTAGAPRIVGSLWDVDDEATLKWMTVFHEELAKASPSVALQRANAATRTAEGGKWASPKYWSAWVLWGLPN